MRCHSGWQHPAAVRAAATVPPTAMIVTFPVHKTTESVEQTLYMCSAASAHALLRQHHPAPVGAALAMHNPTALAQPSCCPNRYFSTCSAAPASPSSCWGSSSHAQPNCPMCWPAQPSCRPTRYFSTYFAAPASSSSCWGSSGHAQPNCTSTTQMPPHPLLQHLLRCTGITQPLFGQRQAVLAK